MTKHEFYARLDDLLENDPGTIKGDEVLTAIPRWDSLAIIGFIALLDQEFGMIVPASKITECRTVTDLVALIEPRVH